MKNSLQILVKVSKFQVASGGENRQKPRIRQKVPEPRLLTLVSNVGRYKFSFIYLTTLDNTSSMICVLAIVPEYSQLE